MIEGEDGSRSGIPARAKAVRWPSSVRVVPTDGPTFVQVLAAERLIPFEVAVGGPAIRKATGLPPLLSGRPEPAALVCSHTRSPTHRSTPTAGVERSRRGWWGPVEAGAPEQRAVEGGGGRWRAVEGGRGRFVFVTGDPFQRVGRLEATERGPEHRFRDGKRDAAS